MVAGRVPRPATSFLFISQKLYTRTMIQKTYLAGGCFWGLEELFKKQNGVVDTETGYTKNAETLEITFDNEKTSFKNILDFFFCIHNPTTLNQQGNDIGSKYRSAIFYQNEVEKKEAEEFVKIVNNSGRWDNPVVTTLEQFDNFLPAEEFHQDYLDKNPGGYTCHVVRFDTYL
jgi:peptide-methionine (S)-S-oxide reductase